MSKEIFVRTRRIRYQIKVIYENQENGLKLIANIRVYNSRLTKASQELCNR